MSELSHQPRTSLPPRPGAKRAPGQRPGRRAGGHVEQRRVRPRSPQSIRARRKRARLPLGAGLVVVVAFAALLVTYVTEGTGTPPATATPGTFAVQAKSLRPLQEIPPATLRSAVAKWPNEASPLIVLPGSTPPLRLHGKPELLYVGANYCPYCAAERWAMLIALSKFGTFSGLKGTTSSTTDINPATPTVTFVGSHFTSPYIAFVPVETHGNVAGATGAYPVLQNLTSEQTTLLGHYDAVPYVPPTVAGGIPFLDLAGRYMSVGSQYDAAKIAGWDFDRAAAYLASGSNTTSEGLRVAAGYLMRDLCQVTRGAPATACR